MGLMIRHSGLLCRVAARGLPAVEQSNEAGLLHIVVSAVQRQDVNVPSEQMQCFLQLVLGSQQKIASDVPKTSITQKRFVFFCQFLHFEIPVQTICPPNNRP